MAFVLDASALLAVVFREPGADAVRTALKAGAQMSTVNAAEVASHLFQDGWTAFGVNALFQGLPIFVLPFDLNTALLCGHYRPLTDHLGLSLGDRACLATAYLQVGTALTADRAWTQVGYPRRRLRCIRQ